MNDASNESPTSEKGPRQLYCPRRIPLVTFNGATGAGGVVRFRANIPDSRLHWKLSLVGIADGSAPARTVLAGRGLKLWLAAVEYDQIAGKAPIPVTDIFGTRAVPVAFPTNAGLGGYSIENFTSAADGIEGEITVPAQLGGVAGGLYLQARYQPATWQIVPWDQWDEMRSACDLHPLSDVLAT